MEECTADKFYGPKRLCAERLEVQGIVVVDMCAMYAVKGQTCFSVMNGGPCVTLQTVLLNMLFWAPTE